MLKTVIFVVILNFSAIIAFPQWLNFPQYDIRTTDWHYIQQQPYINPWIPQQTPNDDDRFAPTAFSENLCKTSGVRDPFKKVIKCTPGTRISKPRPNFSNQDIRGKQAYFFL
jgi:hypothetical protein